MSHLTGNPRGEAQAHFSQGVQTHLGHVGSLFLLLVWLLSLFQTLSIARVTVFPSRPAPPGPIWGEKPVLGYFVFTASLAEKLPRGAGLSQAQFEAVEKIAGQEKAVLKALEQESLPIIQDPELSLHEKRLRIAEMGYNQRVHEAVRASTQALITALGRPTYARLSHWIEKQWLIERKLHGGVTRPSSLRTYRIFATRYDSNGAYTVALPDKCLKFANGGNHVCDGDGYVAGAGYTVFISYEGGTAALVGESGPWNVDDNFWATSADPTPRRMFADLPLGMPEAQAAFFDGYNGGVDQFGREVTAPFGIDLARQVSIDIGLDPGKNDWIDVSFMWTEGWDNKARSKPQETDGTAPAAPTQATVIPIELSKANADGSIVHEVKEGQTLWNIAAAYQINLGEILRLNGMSEGSLIYPGQKLLVKAASVNPTPTGSQDGRGILKIVPSATPRPSRTATPQKATLVAQADSRQNIVSSATPTMTIQQTVTDDPLKQFGSNPILTVIGGLALAGAALILVGLLLSRKS